MDRDTLTNWILEFQGKPKALNEWSPMKALQGLSFSPLPKPNAGTSSDLTRGKTFLKNQLYVKAVIWLGTSLLALLLFASLLSQISDLERFSAIGKNFTIRSFTWDYSAG